MSPEIAPTKGRWNDMREIVVGNPCERKPFAKLRCINETGPNIPQIARGPVEAGADAPLFLAGLLCEVLMPRVEGVDFG